MHILLFPNWLLESRHQCMQYKCVFQKHYAISYHFYQILTMYFYGDQLYQLRNATLADL